jgi:probable F420-dependent oxidoreductase
MPVKFGVSNGGHHWPAADIRAVEELGLDSFWAGEHIVYHRPVLDAVTPLAFAAAVTSRIKIGPATLLLPLRHPTLVAKEFSSLDVLSGGRVILTVGVGGDYAREFAACNVPLNERGQRATEAIEIIRKYWAGGRFDYDGKIFKLQDVDMLPLPVQPGGPPIWVSGRQEGPMRRAATLGDGWNPYMYTPDRCRASFSQVKRIAREAGRTLPADYVWACFVFISVDDDVAKARQAAIADMSTRYAQDFTGLVDKYCAHGPPDRVAEHLARYVAAGVNYFILAPVVPPDRRRDHLERIATDVLPAIRGMVPSPVV